MMIMVMMNIIVVLFVGSINGIVNDDDEHVMIIITINLYV